jgi:ZIP family zinc transporter
MALLAAIGIDILVDGLVLGLAFVAGEKAGFLLTIALTLGALPGSDADRRAGERYRSRLRIIVIVRHWRCCCRSARSRPFLSPRFRR